MRNGRMWKNKLKIKKLVQMTFIMSKNNFKVNKIVKEKEKVNSLNK